MFKIKIAPDDPQSMAQDGASILRSLQNNSLSQVDLIVRESIQNSLDASLSNNGYTDVAFKVDKFDSMQLSENFSEIKDTLREKYSSLNLFLSISDKGTSGLTGTTSSENAAELLNSNFHKLVFGIGKNQNQDGAGGSWGLGKTSYFQIGIGLIFYYTRIQIGEGEYEERLIASLVENNRSAERILTQSERGIAWWGNLDENNQVLPITDNDKISDFLSIFNLNCYKNEETGTTIIIPYLSKSFIQPNYAQDSIENQCYWLNDITENIKMSIQRWYFPRIMNQTYKNHFQQNMLRCAVNNRFISQYELAPTFRILQEIYNSALLGNSVSSNIIVRPIYLKRIGLLDKTNPIGHVAFCTVDKNQAGMLPPNNTQSPLTFLGNFDKKNIDEHTGKFLGYCRKPGMIVEYDFENSWLPGGNIQGDDKMLFALFVPNSQAKLDPKFYPEYKTIEAYLRSLENADHANWVDNNGFSIIKRAKKNVFDEITGAFVKEENTYSSSATTRLSQEMGKALLPPKGFGTRGSIVQRETKEKTQRKHSTKANLSIESVEVLNHSEVNVHVNCFIPKDKACQIHLLVQTQDGKLGENEWIDMFPTIDFPFTISSIQTDDSNLNIDTQVVLENRKIIFSENPEKREIQLIVRIRKNTNQYIPLLIINS